MNLIESDLRERHEYIDAAVEAAVLTIEDPHITKNLGQSATKFADMLADSVVVNVRDSVVQPPATSKDPEALPIFATRPGETLSFDSYYNGQTPRQIAALLQQVRQWGPVQHSDLSLAEHVSTAGSGNISYVMDEDTLATTFTNSLLLDSTQLAQAFKMPPKGIGLVRTRPLLILRMDDDLEHPDEVLLHEAAHVKQAKEQPIVTVASQRAADMLSLRWELEAYHVGSLAVSPRFRQILDSGKHLDFSDNGIVQMGVEIIRQRFADPQDPYRPSGKLMKAIEAEVPSNILHSGLNYEFMLEALRRSRD